MGKASHKMVSRKVSKSCGGELDDNVVAGV